MGLTRCRGDFGLGEASAVEIAETGVPKSYCDANLGYMSAAILSETGRRRAGLNRATQAIIGRRTYQDLPPLTQHYWDLSRSEPTNSLRTPLIRVVWGYRETQ